MDKRSKIGPRSRNEIAAMAGAAEKEAMRMQPGSPERVTMAATAVALWWAFGEPTSTAHHMTLVGKAVPNA